MEELITKGGPIVWLLLGCSFIGLGIFLERFFYLHRASIDVGEFLNGLSNLLKKKHYAEAIHQAAGTPGPVARVMHAALVRPESGREKLSAIVQEAGQLEVPRIERYLPVLGAIGFLAPLLGLLGTVVGLIDTFATISETTGYATPAEVSKGVYVSLITSALGLAVAIPCHLLYAYLRSCCRTLMHDMERAGIEVVTMIDDERENREIISFTELASQEREASEGASKKG